METIERSAPDAAQAGGRSATPAYPSQSTAMDANGTAGIAAGKAARSSAKEPTISGEAAAWAKAARHISRETLERLGVASATAFFPELDRKSEALVFRYPDGWKARAFPGKAFVAGKGFKLAFWNIERVIAVAGLNWPGTPAMTYSWRCDIQLRFIRRYCGRCRLAGANVWRI